MVDLVIVARQRRGRLHAGIEAAAQGERLGDLAGGLVLELLGGLVVDERGGQVAAREGDRAAGQVLVDVVHLAEDERRGRLAVQRNADGDLVVWPSPPSRPG